jgi:hypothetical protein
MLQESIESLWDLNKIPIAQGKLKQPQLWIKDRDLDGHNGGQLWAYKLIQGGRFILLPQHATTSNKPTK